MKDLTKKNLENKNIFILYLNNYNKWRKIFNELLDVFILVSFFYICIHIYNFNNDDELIKVCATSFEELKSINKSNIWYKYFIDDFFNKFNSSSKAINYKFIEIKPEIKTLIPLELEHDISIVKKSVILNKIEFNFIKSIISECDFSKKRIVFLESYIFDNQRIFDGIASDIDAAQKVLDTLAKKTWS